MSALNLLTVGQFIVHGQRSGRGGGGSKYPSFPTPPSQIFATLTIFNDFIKVEEWTSQLMP